MKTYIMKEVRWIPLRSQHDRVCTTQKAILRNNYGFIQLRGECGHGILMLVNSFTQVEESSESQSIDEE